MDEANDLIARILLLGAVLTVTSGGSDTGGSPAATVERSAAERVAPADTPLNLVETPDGFLISTNSGYVTHYLQAFDEAQRKVTDRLEVRSLWYGLAYEPEQKSLVASMGARSVLVIP